MDNQLQKKRKRNATILFIFLDSILLIMGVTFFLKSEYVGGLVALVLILFSILILLIMRRTRVESSNWKA